MGRKNAIFIAATGQNVGKTTFCLGLLAGLRKRFQTVGFIKPVGQQHVRIDNAIDVDKDVALFKSHFNLPATWTDMSPVILPRGFTRNYLDGLENEIAMMARVCASFERIASKNEYTVVEGTGHVGVGSIVNVNNAMVAAQLGLDVILIASGGLGSAFDELALNLQMCQEYGVKVRGVILNRVMDDKREMLMRYFPKALERWGIPLVGAIPYSEFLHQPTIQDFANLFNTELIAGSQYRYRHFRNSRLVADSVKAYLREIRDNELIITPASREDIIEATIEKYRQVKATEKRDMGGGMIWTGVHHPSHHLLKEVREVNIPTLYVPLCSYEAMSKIVSLISKIRTGDLLKIEKAIDLVEDHLNFDIFTGQ
jgi:hypothetical protein